jgi:hypothetical protein
MAHIILAQQLAGDTTVLLASSSEDHKRLFVKHTITVKRFSVTTHTSYFVQKHNKTVYTSDELHLAITKYNGIKSEPISYIEEMPVRKMDEQSLCYSCTNQMCRLHLYNSFRCRYYTQVRISNKV